MTDLAPSAVNMGPYYGRTTVRLEHRYNARSFPWLATVAYKDGEYEVYHSAPGENQTDALIALLRSMLTDQVLYDPAAPEPPKPTPPPPPPSNERNITGGRSWPSGWFKHWT